MEGSCEVLWGPIGARVKVPTGDFGFGGSRSLSLFDVLSGKAPVSLMPGCASRRQPRRGPKRLLLGTLSDTLNSKKP